MKTVKHLLKNADDPFLALLSYRSTPLPWCGMSPAELLMGRKIRTTLPQTTDSLVPQWPYLQEFRSANEEFKRKQKADHAPSRLPVTTLLSPPPQAVSSSRAQHIAEKPEENK